MRTPFAFIRTMAIPALVVALALAPLDGPSADFVATDPGVRGGPPGAGGPLPGLDAVATQLFLAGQESIQEIDSVSGTIPNTGSGLGPRFNMDSCVGCHASPAVGGSTPPANPQVALATKEGATNSVPFFVALDGPILDPIERRRPNGVLAGRRLALYTVTGRTDAPGCNIAQPDFEALAAADNLDFHVPLPLFGRGLMEAIDDSTILANQEANGSAKRLLGIKGRPGGVLSGRVGRFGWKATGTSLLLIAAQAYNGEVGVTNALSPRERDQTPGCQFNATPEDRGHPQAPNLVDRLPDFAKIASFIRFLAPPEPAPDTPSTAAGREVFTQIGCALCHTPSLPTGNSPTRALRHVTAFLYSDLLLHQMGPGLADGVVEGGAGPDEFRTPPLWGLGQRIFFLHDGRTTDLRAAIEAHASAGREPYPPSEANAVIDLFHALTEPQKQSLLDFLRAL